VVNWLRHFTKELNINSTNATVEPKKYRKCERQTVVAIQLNLETDGFSYQKWGSKQQCSAGDWLVDNMGDVYTINNDSFANTYTEIAPGQYIKTAAVWASQADKSGKIKTNEGFTEYAPGDYLVSNNADGTDAYAVAKVKFEKMYELLPDE